jgi:molecular chaperone HtpG
MLSFLNEFDGKPLQSVARGDLDLGALDDEEKQQQEKVGEEMKPLVEKMKEALEGKAKDVRLTFRLTDSPSCLVADEGDMSGYLQRMLKAAGQNAPQAEPILEVNPEHPLVKALQTDNANFADWCHLLFDQALLAEGGALEDPASFVKRTNALLLAR